MSGHEHADRPRVTTLSIARNRNTAPPHSENDCGGYAPINYAHKHTMKGSAGVSDEHDEAKKILDEVTALIAKFPPVDQSTPEQEFELLGELAAYQERASNLSRDDLDFRADVMIAMRAKGRSLKEIGEISGVSMQRVSRIIKVREDQLNQAKSKD